MVSLNEIKGQISPGPGNMTSPFLGKENQDRLVMAGMGHEGNAKSWER